MKDHISVNGQDGTFAAYIARPKTSPAPAVVVLQELFGVNADIRKTCDELADQGFLAVAPDLFWRQLFASHGSREHELAISPQHIQDRHGEVRHADSLGRDRRWGRSRLPIFGWRTRGLPSAEATLFVRPAPDGLMGEGTFRTAPSYHQCESPMRGPRQAGGDPTTARRWRRSAEGDGPIPRPFLGAGRPDAGPTSRRERRLVGAPSPTDGPAGPISEASPAGPPVAPRINAVAITPVDGRNGRRRELRSRDRQRRSG
jgi:hypothetical protein